MIYPILVSSITEGGYVTLGVLSNGCLRVGPVVVGGGGTTTVGGITTTGGGITTVGGITTFAFNY